MDPLHQLLAGAVLGLSIAAPIGPSALLLIQRTIGAGLGSGIATGCGFATVHVLYAVVAGLGIAVVNAWSAQYAGEMRLAGGLVLIWIGVGAFRRCRSNEAQDCVPASLPGCYGSGMLFNFANPMTPLLFTLFLPSIGDPAGLPADAILLMAAGVAIGSMGWWLVLAGAISLIRRRLNAWGFSTMRRASAGVLVALGLLLLAGSFHHSDPSRAVPSELLGARAAAPD